MHWYVWRCVCCILWWGRGSLVVLAGVPPAFIVILWKDFFHATCSVCLLQHCQIQGNFMTISNIHTEQILHVIVYVHHWIHFLVESKVKGLNETLYDHRVNCQGRINSLILLLIACFLFANIFQIVVGL